MTRTFSRRLLLLSLLLCAFAAAPAARAALAPADAAAGLAGQIDVALTHATFALGSDTDRGFQTHAHHVVNILVGEAGMGFDASFGNPGDGYGALEYARDLRSSREVAAAGWESAAQNIAWWLEQAAKAALEATRAADAGDVNTGRTSLVTAVGLLSAAKGREGETAPVAGALSLAAAIADALPAADSGTSTGGGGGYY